VRREPGQITPLSEAELAADRARLLDIVSAGYVESLATGEAVRERLFGPEGFGR
jgi:hypothetical protein